MPHKIGHVQQIVQNYFATLTMQPVTLNFCAELLCSVFSALCFFFLLQTTSMHTTFYIHYYDEQEKNKMRRILKNCSRRGFAKKNHLNLDLSKGSGP